MKTMPLSKTFLWLLITACTLCISCKKYLDQKSDNSLVTPDTLADLQGLLDDNTIMNANTPAFGEACADDYFVTQDVYNSIDLLSQKAYIWTLENYNYPNDWASDYNVIYNSNYCLDALTKIARNEGDAATWNTVKGSALFYRSYYFLGLLWDFAKAYDSTTSGADPGIVLRLTSDFNVPSSRASVQQCYNQLTKDLYEAATMLPLVSAQPMRPSRAAAYGALARAYLSMRKYDSAYKYADAALSLKNDLLDYNGADVNPASQVPFEPFNSEIVFYTSQSGNYTTKLYFYALVDTSLFASYLPNDLRRDVFFYANNGYYSFKGNYAAALYPPFSGIATDELYLIRAECSARSGAVQQAMNDLNTLLIRRWKTGTFVPVAATSQDNALQTVLAERRKELLLRGLRWIDIKRLNKEGYAITPERVIGTQVYKLRPGSRYYALPLPQDIVKQAGIQQN